MAYKEIDSHSLEVLLMDDELIRVIASNEEEWRKFLLKCIDQINRHLEQQNGRIRKMENWQWRIVGAVGATGFIVWLIENFGK